MLLNVDLTFTLKDPDDGKFNHLEAMTFYAWLNNIMKNVS